MTRPFLLVCGLWAASACVRPASADETCAASVRVHQASLMPHPASPGAQAAVLVPLRDGLWQGLMRQAARVIAGVDIDAPSEQRRGPAPVAGRGGKLPRTILSGDAA